MYIPLLALIASIYGLDASYEKRVFLTTKKVSAKAFSLITAHSFRLC